MSADRGGSRGGGFARRRILGMLGLAGTAPLWLAGARAADEPPKPAPPVPAAPVASPPAAPAGPSDDARGLAELARRRYGAHLDDARMGLLVEEIDDNLKSGERLRKVKLANADEPDFIFRAEP